jgi:hypothetical protein
MGTLKVLFPAIRHGLDGRENRIETCYQKGGPASPIGDGVSAFQQWASTGVIRRCPAFRNLKLNQRVRRDE